MTISIKFNQHYSGFSLDVEVELPGQGVSALFGPSGSGKTTLLRCIAGLVRAEGHLTVDGEIWQNDKIFLATHRRPIGYVFQEASLFPHLDVAANLDYGMKRAGSAGKVDRAGIIELLGIGHLLGRGAEHLSGGERQRVAIARALLTAPRLLLLDEPLAALDTARKREILPYLERLHDELEIPMIYVSHAPDEVARLTDHLVLMENGRVLGSGPLAEMSARLDLPTARDEEGGVVIDAVIGGHDEAYHLTRLDTVGGSLWVTRRPLDAGHRARLRILARDVSIALDSCAESSIVNRLSATVTAIADGDNPAQVLVGLDAGGTALLARITRRSLDQLNLVPGKAVWAQIKSVSLLA